MIEHLRDGFPVPMPRHTPERAGIGKGGEAGTGATRSRSCGEHGEDPPIANPEHSGPSLPVLTGREATHFPCRSAAGRAFGALRLCVHLSTNYTGKVGPPPARLGALWWPSFPVHYRDRAGRYYVE